LAESRNPGIVSLNATTFEPIVVAKIVPPIDIDVPDKYVAVEVSA
jgi:hypothetical protein